MATDQDGQALVAGERSEPSFGDLNPAFSKQTGPTIDRGTSNFWGQVKSAVQETFKKDATSGMGPYKAILLRKEPEEQGGGVLTGWMKSLFPSGLMDKPLGKYRCRIPELHAHLPQPTDDGHSGNPMPTDPVIDMYPIFIAESSETDDTACPGDTVWVDFGNRETMEDPTFLGPLFPSAGGSGTSAGAADGAGGGASGAYSGGCGGALGTAGLQSEAAKGDANTSYQTQMSGALGGLETVPVVLRNSVYLEDAASQKEICAADPLGEANGGPTDQDSPRPGLDSSMDEAFVKYIQDGGSGRASSGTVGLAGAEQEGWEIKDKFLLALRLMIEDQAGRPYAQGCKSFNFTSSGIDASGFVNLVLIGTELIMGGNEAFGNQMFTGFDGRGGEGEEEEKHWSHGISFRIGDFAHGIYESARIGKWNTVHGSADFNKSWQDYHDPIMPGDVLFVGTGNGTEYPGGVDDDGGALFLREPATWEEYKESERSTDGLINGITHVAIAYAGPSGELRIAESHKEYYGGVGSETWQNWYSRNSGNQIYAFQPEHMREIWGGSWFSGGRPDDEWNEELAQDEAPSLFTGELSPIEKASVGEAEATQVEGSQGYVIEEGGEASETTEDTESGASASEEPTEEGATETAATTEGAASETSSASGEGSTPTDGTETAANPSAPSAASVCGGGYFDENGNLIVSDPKMKLVRVEMDQCRYGFAAGKGYGAVKVREDVAPAFSDIKRVLNELGCVFASVGAIRPLDASVGPGRSATSFHYTGLAVDIWTHAGLYPDGDPETDEYVCVFQEDGRKFYVYARSDMPAGTSAQDAMGNTHVVESLTLDAIDVSSGTYRVAPPGTNTVSGNFVHFTNLASAYGMHNIGGRAIFYSHSKAHSEWWHFESHNGLVPGQTTFGDVLLTMYDQGGEPPWAEGQRTWTGGYFKN